MELVPLDEIFQSFDYLASYGDMEGGRWSIQTSNLQSIYLVENFKHLR